MTLQTMGEASGPPLTPLVTSDLMHTPQLEDCLDNALVNCRKGLSPIAVLPQNMGTFTICAGGPSLKGFVNQIRDKQKYEDAFIFAVNDTYDYLFEHGIVPDAFAMCEIAPWPKDFLVHAVNSTAYYMCSIANPSAVDRLKDFKVKIWHVSASDEDVAFKHRYEKIVEKYYPGTIYVGGGEAVSLKAINLGMVLGFRNFEMYGVDGCYRNGETSHAYMNRPYEPLQVECAGRRFTAPYYLARQADDLRRMCLAWHPAFKLRCFGDGLVQHMHRTGWPEQYA